MPVMDAPGAHAGGAVVAIDVESPPARRGLTLSTIEGEGQPKTTSKKALHNRILQAQPFANRCSEEPLPTVLTTT